ncbi:MAG: hypothetical protein AAGF12_42415 [Myxococcota bacterium]
MDSTRSPDDLDAELRTLGATPYLTSPAVGVATLRNLVVYVERRLPELDQIQALQRALDVTVRAHGPKSAHLHYVDFSHGARFDESRRARFTELAKRYNGRLGVAAFVVVGGGFGGAIIRSVITKILLVIRQRTPTAMSDNLDDAARFYRREIGRAPSADEMNAVVDVLCSDQKVRQAKPE